MCRSLSLVVGHWLGAAAGSEPVWSHGTDPSCLLGQAGPGTAVWPRLGRYRGSFSRPRPRMTQHVNSPAQWARASTHRHSGHTHYDMTQRVPVLHHAWPPPPALLIAAYPLLPPHLAAIGSPDRRFFYSCRSPARARLGNYTQATIRVTAHPCHGEPEGTRAASPACHWSGGATQGPRALLRRFSDAYRCKSGGLSRCAPP
jgi:hypothetical protein